MRVPQWKGEWDVISTVFFDVGSTLMYACPSVPEAFALAAREHGFNLSVRDVEPFMDEVDRFYEQEYLRDGDFWCSHERSVMIWKDVYGILARRTGLGEHAALLAEATHAKYRTAAFWALYDDVVPCLRTLKLSGHRLGVISNWDAGLEALLREAYDQIAAGKPTVIHVMGASGQHWITLIGYQNVTDPDHLTLANFTALDPWDGAEHNPADRYTLYGDFCEHISEA